MHAPMDKISLYAKGVYDVAAEMIEIDGSRFGMQVETVTATRSRGSAVGRNAMTSGVPRE